MGRILLTTLFLVVLMVWLRYEFKRPVSVTKYWPWVAAALTVQGLSDIAFGIIGGVTGNFIYHAVGGGVMSALLFVYLLKTYDVKLNWRVELVLLYAFVSALGVMNELAEYAGELAGLGVFSWDSHDTWRDFVANTSGALGMWLLYKLAAAFNKRLRSSK